MNVRTYAIHAELTEHGKWEKEGETNSLWSAKEMLVVGIEYGIYNRGTIYDRSTGALLEINESREICYA